MGGLRTNVDRLRAMRYEPPAPGGESDRERERKEHRMRMGTAEAPLKGSGRHGAVVEEAWASSRVILHFSDDPH